MNSAEKVVIGAAAVNNKGFRRIITEIFGLLLGETADVSRRFALMGRPQFDHSRSVGAQDAEMYLAAIWRLLIYVIGAPIAIVAIGIIGHLKWLIATAGIIWAIFTVLLSTILLVPRVLANLMVIIGKESSGLTRVSLERYVNTVLTIIFTESCATLFFTVFPVHNNLGAIPLLILASLILSLAGLKILKKAMIVLAGIVLVGLLISFSFPQTAGEVAKKAEKTDNAVADFVAGRSISLSTAKGERVTKEPEVIKNTPTEYAERVTLRGPAVPSRAIEISHPGWDYYAEGPAQEIEFDDGTKGPITKNYGFKGGSIKFYGPAGEFEILKFKKKKEV